MTAPLIAQAVHKRYGRTAALDGLDLRVESGHVHALLGPNGAGKTTAVRIFATLTRLDEGEVHVAGIDLRRRPRDVRRTIGLVGQSPAVDEVLHGQENLELFGRLLGLHRPAARARAEELLERFGLTDAARRPVATYSGGMRRRLDIAAGLLLRPTLLFLDEPTTGLDPRGRAEVWAMVRDVVAVGTTVLLTTQYLDEADRLADRVTVIAAGRVIAEGSPAELKSRLGGDRVSLSLPQGASAEPAVAALVAAGLGPVEVTVTQPSLDDVFLHLTDPAALEGAA